MPINPEHSSSTGRAADELARFSRDIAPLNMMPLWERTARMRPGTSCVAAHWRYADVRPHLLRSVDLISKRDAERRVLALENPSLRGTTYVAATLYAGLQIIMPGEIARSHRHSPNALRFVLEGEGAYTSVEGERVPMHPGDFVVTPNWTWHDHGHQGQGPVIWMDGLDTPFASFFGTVFREDHPQETQPLTRATGTAQARYGAAMLPADEPLPAGPATPLLSYPYARTREALATLTEHARPHAAHAFRLRYAHPVTGAHPFPTMAVFMQRLPARFAGQPYRSTESIVFCAVEGHGTVALNDRRFEWAPHDVFIVPAWETYRLSSEPGSVLFSYSDRAGQEALGFWREELLS